MSGFQSPNYTQTPNDFFVMLPDMTEAEARVTLVMIRQTFGFHRGEFKMGVRKLAAAAGLSRQGALDGAVAAEKRGTFRRTNPDAQGEAEWELVINPADPLQPVEAPIQSVEASPLPSGGQVGVKERNKEIEKMPFDWKLAHGQPITQTELDTAQFKDKAQKQFEAAFQFGKLPWDSTQAWEKFSRFVCLVYRDDPQAFGNYIVWRAGDGKYSAMNNKQIRLNPQVFIDTWPEFMATAKPTKPQINAEAVEDTKRRLAEKEAGKRYVPPPDSVRARLGKLTADKSVKGGMT